MQKKNAFTKLVTIIFATAILFTIAYPFLLYADNIDKNTVRDVQLMLALKGIHKGAIDGITGPVTSNAIEEYQRIHKMVVTGEVSGPLRDELYKDIDSLLESKTNNQTNKSEGEQIKEPINTHEEIKSLAEELRRTKNDLQNTNVALKGMNDGIAGHFVSNFRDLVAVVGTGMGIALALIGIFIAYGVPKLADYIQNEVSLAHKKELVLTGSKINWGVYTNLSHAFYRYYRGFEDRGHRGFQSGVDLAIWFSDGAVAFADKMPDDPEKQDMKEYAEQHRAYHYASQKAPSPLNRQIALNLVPQIKGLADKYYTNKNSKWINCKDTVAWILIRLGDEKQQAQGKRVLEELLEELEKERRYILPPRGNCGELPSVKKPCSGRTFSRKETEF